jgi:hypothetical protein
LRSAAAATATATRSSDPIVQLHAIAREPSIWHARSHTLGRIANDEMAALTPEHYTEIAADTPADRGSGRVDHRLGYCRWALHCCRATHGGFSVALAGHRRRALVPRGRHVVAHGDRRSMSSARVRHGGHRFANSRAGLAGDTVVFARWLKSRGCVSTTGTWTGLLGSAGTLVDIVPKNRIASRNSTSLDTNAQLQVQGGPVAL